MPGPFHAQRKLPTTRTPGRLSARVEFRRSFRAERRAPSRLYAFFQAAYHLADYWLKNSRAGSRADVESFVNSTTSLVFCRDICNGSKHFRLDKYQRSKRVGLIREYVPASQGRPAGSVARLFAFEAQDGSVDLADIEELMSDCVRAWHTYCQTLA
jgi:hypothetical protein